MSHELGTSPVLEQGNKQANVASPRSKVYYLISLQRYGMAAGLLQYTAGFNLEDN
jgi:hypothetical protein